MKLQLLCETCGVTTSEVSRETSSTQIIKLLECGHESIEELFSPVPQSFSFEDGRTPYPHQLENLSMARTSNHRWLCADDTGIGKTLTAAGTLRLWGSRLSPVLIVCKSSLRSQWCYEILSTCGMDWIPYPLEKSDEKIPSGFNVVVVSYDILSRIKNPIEAFSRFNYVVLDEVQAIKNLETKRTKAVQDICAGKPYVLGLGATPFKNSFVEYFPILNLLDPGKFYSQQSFINRFVGTYWSSSQLKYGGLDPYAAPEFKRLTKYFVIRHERSEVMSNLPPVLRTQFFCEFQDKRSYNKANEEMLSALEDCEEGGYTFENQRKLQMSLMLLKHIAGQQKVPHAIEYVRSFLEENPPNGETPRKLTLFVHHKDVGEEIEAAVAEMAPEFSMNPPTYFRGDWPAAQKDAFSRSCAQYHWHSNNPLDRILIASTLSGGEGLNLQECYDGLLVERQWNPQNEAQAEGRFPRPGSAAKGNVFWKILTLIGSLDEELTTINERKASYMPNITGDISEGEWRESNFMLELGRAIREKKARGARQVDSIKEG